MSRQIPISEIVRRVGDESIQVQNVAHNMSGGRQMKDHGLITFATSKENCSEIMKQAAGLGTAKIVGLILWMPADKVNEIYANPEP